MNGEHFRRDTEHAARETLYQHVSAESRARVAQLLSCFRSSSPFGNFGQLHRERGQTVSDRPVVRRSASALPPAYIQPGTIRVSQIFPPAFRYSAEQSIGCNSFPPSASSLKGLKPATERTRSSATPIHHWPCRLQSRSSGTHPNCWFAVPIAAGAVNTSVCGMSRNAGPAVVGWSYRVDRVNRGDLLLRATQ